MFDPVTWAAKFLDWHCIDPDGAHWKRKHKAGTLGKLPPYNEFQAKAGKSIFHRPYQKVILSCTAKRTVLRCGRQLGKCLVSGTTIQMADGSLKAIEDIVDGEQIIGIDASYNFTPAIAYKSFNGIRQVAKLELNDGREIEASFNHPFLVRRNIGRQTTGKRHVIHKDSWVELKDLQPGDCIAVPTNIGELGPLDYEDTSKLKILGLMLADGNLTSDNCRFSNQNYEILKDMRLACTHFDCHLHQYPSDAENDYHILGNSRYINAVRKWFRKIGLWGLDSHRKFIPEFVFNLKNEYIALLLNRMYGCDGWACVCKDGSPQIGYCTVSEVLANQIVSLLNRFGIYADVRRKATKLNGKTFYSRQITISRRESILRFINNIGILGKDDAVQLVKKVAFNRKPSPKTEVYESNDIAFLPIRSIKSTGLKPTWDLSVPDIKNFIANNIISHNTELFCIVMLHAMFTNDDFPITVIAPYQSQVELIFTRITQFIKSNPILANSVVRNVKAPSPTIQLSNGSAVIGFTAGTRSGQDAGASRGQSSKMLLFDEADMLSPADIDAALAIITNFPDATVWMSSTPTGKRERFYSTCHSKEWKEFHHPSHVNPNWTDELDRLYKDTLTEAGYQHEILGLFGEQEEGVYQAKYVEVAQSNYEYSEMKPEKGWHYSIGVDWNDRLVGVSIAVIGLNPAEGKFYLCDKKTVSRTEYTQLQGCQAVVEYNRIWQPFSIYVDRGFGATSIEVLRKHSLDSLSDPNASPADKKLARILKPYDFGSALETRDLFTKQKVKKQAKPFLVENSVRRFEQKRFCYPESDEMFTKALLGYIVKKVSAAGVPVYEQQDTQAGDHLLDAVNLGLVAFTLEKSEIGTPKYDNTISFSGPLGMVGQDPSVTAEEYENNRPKTGRADFRQPGLIATNTMPGKVQGGDTRLWTWPGFGHDAPRPRTRTISEAFGEADQRISSRTRRRSQPPRRRKF